MKKMMTKSILLGFTALLTNVASAGCEETAKEFIETTYHETVNEVKSMPCSQGCGTKEVWIGTTRGSSFSVYFNGPGCEWISKYIRWK